MDKIAAAVLRKLESVRFACQGGKFTGCSHNDGPFVYGISVFAW